MLHQSTAFDRETASELSRRSSPGPMLVVPLPTSPEDEFEGSEARQRMALMRDPTFVLAIFVGIYLILASAVVVLVIAGADALRGIVHRLRDGR